MSTTTDVWSSLRRHGFRIQLLSFKFMFFLHFIQGIFQTVVLCVVQTSLFSFWRIDKRKWNQVTLTFIILYGFMCIYCMQQYFSSRWKACNYCTKLQHVVCNKLHTKARHYTCILWNYWRKNCWNSKHSKCWWTSLTCRSRDWQQQQLL